jgi:hypothetical protein
MAISVAYEIRADLELLNAPVIKKVTYRDGLEILSSKADPTEIKVLEPELLEEYFLAYKSYLTEYLNSFNSFEEASTRESVNSHISAYAVAYYFRDLAEMVAASLEAPAPSLEEDEEL